MACLGNGDIGAARAYLEEAVSLARNFNNKREMAAANNALAMLYRIEGRFEAAEPLYASALALARQLGDREYIAAFLLNLAIVSIARSSLRNVPSMLLEALTIAEETGSKPAAQSALEVCAALAAAGGDWTHAAQFFSAAEEQTGQTGLQRDPADEAFLAPVLAKTRQLLTPDDLAVAVAKGRSLACDQALAEAKAWLSADATVE
jgi:tetratricopeptide (TPR) repeat protein